VQGLSRDGKVVPYLDLFGVAWPVLPCMQRFSLTASPPSSPSLVVLRDETSAAAAASGRHVGYTRMGRWGHSLSPELPSGLLGLRKSGGLLNGALQISYDGTNALYRILVRISWCIAPNRGAFTLTSCLSRVCELSSFLHVNSTLHQHYPSQSCSHCPLHM